MPPQEPPRMTMDFRVVDFTMIAEYLNFEQK